MHRFVRQPLRKFPVAAGAWAIASAALFACIGSEASRAQTPEQQHAAEGKSIVDKHCSRCHQTGRSGASRLAPAPPFRDLMERYPAEALEEALGEGLASGHPDMPEFVFEPDEIAAIVAYFASLRAAR